MKKNPPRPPPPSPQITYGIQAKGGAVQGIDVSHEVLGGHVGQAALADGHVLQPGVLHQAV